VNDKTTKSEPVSEEIAEYLAMAKAAQAKKRAQAPELSMKEATQVEQKRMFAMYCPEAVGPNATYHVMMGDRELLRQNVQEGYEVVLDKGRMVTYGKAGDVMLKIPLDLHKRNLQIPVMKDKRMQEAHRNEEIVGNRKNPASGGERITIAKPGEPVYDSGGRAE
jgi:hypothetical protein